jgi:hypothetical protein
MFCVMQHVFLIRTKNELTYQGITDLCCLHYTSRLRISICWAEVSYFNSAGTLRQILIISYSYQT